MNVCSDTQLIEMESQLQPSLTNQLDENTAIHLAQLFGALADPSRLRIIAALVWHHLRDLRHLRIVKTRKEGRFVYYTLDDDHVIDLFKRGLEHVRHG